MKYTMTTEEYLAYIRKNYKAGESKYRNRKVVVDGVGTFASQKEADRWFALKALEQAGEISGLKRQVRYEVLPEQRNSDGKLLERARRYIADFVYQKGDETIVEDCKGYRTDAYKLKKALMLFMNGIEVLET